MKGGPPAGALIMKMCDVLDDREWHPFEDVAKEVGKTVPPGKAIRRNELRRKGQNQSNRTSIPEGRVRPVTEERQIAYGRRSFVRETFNTHRSSFETRVEDGVEFIRLVKLPPSVARDRARVRAHYHYDPVDLADELKAGADASALLSELTHQQLLKVAIELADRHASQSSA